MTKNEKFFIIGLITFIIITMFSILRLSGEEHVKETKQCSEFCINKKGMWKITKGWTNYCICNDGTTVPI